MYDKDGSGEVDLEEMVEIFVLVYGMQVTQPNLPLSRSGDLPPGFRNSVDIYIYIVIF